MEMEFVCKKKKELVIGGMKQVKEVYVYKLETKEFEIFKDKSKQQFINESARIEYSECKSNQKIWDAIKANRGGGPFGTQDSSFKPPNSKKSQF